MSGQAIKTTIDGRYRNGNHFTLEFRQSAFRQHEVVVHIREGPELRFVEGIGFQNIRNQAELFLA